MIGQKDGTYNRMTKFRIGEVSSVDRPAQGPGARMEIMKRDEVEKKHALTDPMDGHSHETHFTREQLSASSEKSDHADRTPTEDNTMNEEQFNEKIAEITKQLEDSNLRAERAEQVASMTDVEKAFHAGLEGEAADEFLKSENKAEQVAKAEEMAKSADPVVATTLDGVEILKSQDPTGLLTQMVEKAKKDKKKMDDDEEEKGKLKFLAAKAELEKRASGDEYANLPGTPEMKAEMLKALDAIEDEGIRKAAHEALVAKNESLASAFEEVGTVGSPDPIVKSLSDKLDVIRDGILKDQPELSKSQAYVKAIETKEGLEIYAEMQNPQEAI